MPAALRVLLDDSEIVTVSSSALDLVDVRVSATRVEPEIAAVEVHGGTYTKPGESRYLIWVEHQPLKAGQRISVEFLPDGHSSSPGKTVEDLYPESEAEPKEPDVSLSRDEMLDQLATRPKAHRSLSCKVSLPTGSSDVRIEEAEHGYAFGVTWRSHRPNEARVSLHSYSIESMRRNEVGTYHLQTTLALGQSACVEVGA